MPVKKAAGIVVFHRGPGNKIEYLLLKHNQRYWNFPKGGIEKGEREVEAAKREVFEEAGIKDIDIKNGFREREKYFYKASRKYSEEFLDGKIVVKLVVFFLGEAKTKDVKISHEHEGYEWLDFKGSFERFGRNRFHNKSQAILKKADDFIFHRKRAVI
ncbi:NUDIX domain-containing protein [Patescibacteria group bacterium]|nr:NUDIX domain-containing protein [Patescibacteria group bacterium]